MNYTIEQFKNRECKAKEIFYIKEIDKMTAYDFVRCYHYLGDAKFFCIQSFGLFLRCNNALVGVASYQLPQGTTTLKGWFNLPNNTKNIYELGRLCMLPALNGTNATSFLLGGSIKELRKMNNIKKEMYERNFKVFTVDDYVCRAVITLACSERHVGSIYQVCNFKYYGLTSAKTDFFTADGKINPRGSTRDIEGVWLPRPRKHRYAYILDDNLSVNYPEQVRPSVNQTIKTECCNSTQKVYDKRFNQWYTCPRCTGKLERINVEDE